MNTFISRRAALRQVTGAAATLSLAIGSAARLAAAETSGNLKGRIHHSVCRWCYKEIPLDTLCQAGKEIGLSGIDLINPEDFATAKKHGLVCSMVNNPVVDGLGGIPKAWNRVEHHDKLAAAYEQRIQETANAGFERLICFSGNRAGLDDEKGLENCALGIKRILPAAEKHKVTICMELLNSKRNHKDYQCDHTRWGVDLVNRVASERFKLLYDIFHMQIMEGDVCDTIRENSACIDHYHTGGVPGRNEIDETQELHYPRIMAAILATGFNGYVGQEFIPKRQDKIASLRQGIEICDV